MTENTGRQRRALATAFLLAMGASSWPGWATEGKVPINIHNDVPAVVEVLDRVSGRVLESGPVDPARRYLAASRPQRVIVRVHGRVDFLHVWDTDNPGDLRDAAFPVDVPMALPHPDWIRIIGILSLMVIGMLGFLTVRSRRRSVHLENVISNQEPGSLPQRIGAYKVLSELGQGGMATVYEVQDKAHVRYALKWPARFVLEDAGMRHRMAREMRLGVALQHPRLVHMVDSGTPDQPYLVMELVEGTTLDDAPARTPAEAVRIALEILEGLAYIHGQGVVHRDIKPSNIMLLSDGHIKIMDFGIAHHDHTQHGRLTATDQVLGTMAYMAPEQLQSQPVDGRTDLYPVGLMLYEDLTGRRAYGGELHEIITQKLGDGLPPLRAVRPDLPPSLAVVVDTLMETDPDKRYRTAAEASIALQAATLSVPG